MANNISIHHLLAALLMWLLSPSALSNQHDLREVSFYTEAYPPANYLHDDTITGFAVEILLEASALVGEPIAQSQLVLQPWARSYRTVLTHKNSVLFSTTRSDHREKLFQWVGPIIDAKIIVLARKDAEIKIDKPLDMANYRIGVIRDDIGEQSLLELGVPRDAMQEALDVMVLVEQLMKKRIDLLVYSDNAAYWWSRQAGIDAELFEEVYVVKEGGLYYAVNRDTDKAIVDKLQKGLDMLKQTDASGHSRYQEILDKY